MLRKAWPAQICPGNRHTRENMSAGNKRARIRIRCINLLYRVAAFVQIFRKPWRERDINAAAAACRNMDSCSSPGKLTLLESHRATRARRLSNLSNISGGSPAVTRHRYNRPRRLYGHIYVCHESVHRIRACTGACTANINDQPRGKANAAGRRRAASRLISTLSASGGVWIYRT